jgi:hypothetical protein
MSFLGCSDLELTSTATNPTKAVTKTKTKSKTKSKVKRKTKTVSDDTDATITSVKTKTKSKKAENFLVTKKKPAKKKTVFKDLFSIKDQVKDHWFNIWNPNYIMFSPLGEGELCETIGIDIGWKHLAITGLRKEEGETIPRVVWFCIMSTEIDIAGEFNDYLDDLIRNHPDFAWVRFATRFRIEQQVGVNTKALMIASALRCCFRCISEQRGIPIDVEYVHGNDKYKVGPRYSDDCKDDPIRQMERSGLKGKGLRKQLSVNDLFHLLPLTEEHDALEFAKLLEDFLDQLHDIADSYFIARWSYEPDGKIPKKKADKLRALERKRLRDEKNRALGIEVDDTVEVPAKKPKTKRKRKVVDDETDTSPSKKTKTKSAVKKRKAEEDENGVEEEQDAKKKKQEFFRKKNFMKRFRA